MSKNVLIIDDESSMRHMLSTVLEKAGYAVTDVPDAEQALSLLEDRQFDIILCDMRMPHMDGLAFLEEIADRGINTTTIAMSAYGTIDTAVEAMKLGAADYISKPFRPDEIMLKLAQQEETSRLKQENLRLREAVQESVSFENMVAKSRPMRQVFETIRKIADYKTTVLITGESGTGKELIARAIHFNGTRKRAPIVAVNCGGLPENLLESELFGYVKGAFTDAARDKPGLFQEAHGGTLFLDEVGDLPLALQVKLLRVLQDEMVRPLGSTENIKVDVRIIAATAADLAEGVRKGVFRDDLFYRINVLRIEVPALRKRKEDIPLLVNHFVQRYNARLHKQIRGIRPDALQVLMDYPWPGNVRELENVIERTMALSESEEIEKKELPPDLLHCASHIKGGWPPDSLSIKANTMALENQLVREALRQTNGNRTRAAKLLGISHPTLLSKMKAYGISYDKR
ncbi:MAG: sigma-54-dependent Fis family transcriptional regulator [Deltaproteobacteria bacterium]|nr:sigma-54-dependent Fis family transcriptional regulator [Deltaproteobacteria bacterium]